MRGIEVVEKRHAVPGLSPPTVYWVALRSRLACISVRVVSDSERSIVPTMKRVSCVAFNNTLLRHHQTQVSPTLKDQRTHVGRGTAAPKSRTATRRPWNERFLLLYYFSRVCSSHRMTRVCERGVRPSASEDYARLPYVRVFVRKWRTGTRARRGEFARSDGRLILSWFSGGFSAKGTRSFQVRFGRMKSSNDKAQCVAFQNTHLSTVQSQTPSHPFSKKQRNSCAPRSALRSAHVPRSKTR